MSQHCVPTTKRLCFLTAAEMLEGYQSLTLSPTDVVLDVLKRIDEVNDRANAYCYIEKRETLINLAKESEERYKNKNPLPMDGVPISVKDLFMIKGMKTLFGSKAFSLQRQEDFDRKNNSENDNLALIDTVDSPSVELARNAGCIIMGKVTSPEFGWQGVTISPMTGVTGNPFNFKLSGGGSSGGSNCVMLGMGPLSIGSDGAGSARIPCAFSNVSSIKASVSVVPHSPASTLGTLAHVCPMATTIKDAALFLDVIGQPHPSDPLSIHPSRFGKPNDLYDSQDSSLEKRKYSTELELGVKGLRIGLNFTLSPYCDPEIEKSVRQAAKVLEDLGAIVEEVEELPFQKEKLDVFGAFKVLWCTGCKAMVERRVRSEYRHLVDPNLIDAGARGDKYSAYEYLNSEMIRTTMSSLMDTHYFNKYDILITPTLPIKPFEAHLETIPDEIIRKQLCGQANPNAPHLTPADSPFFEPEYDPKRWWMFCQYTYPFNLMKLPASNVPCAKFTGLQVVGPQYAESLVLRVANTLQNNTSLPFLQDLSKNTFDL